MPIHIRKTGITTIVMAFLFLEALFKDDFRGLSFQQKQSRFGKKVRAKRSLIVNVKINRIVFTLNKTKVKNVNNH